MSSSSSNALMGCDAMWKSNFSENCMLLLLNFTFPGRTMKHTKVENESYMFSSMLAHFLPHRSMKGKVVFPQPYNQLLWAETKLLKMCNVCTHPVYVRSSQLCVQFLSLLANSGRKTRYVLLDLDKLSHRLPHRKFEIRDKCWLPFLGGSVREDRFSSKQNINRVVGRNLYCIVRSKYLQSMTGMVWYSLFKTCFMFDEQRQTADKGNIKIMSFMSNVCAGTSHASKLYGSFPVVRATDELCILVTGLRHKHLDNPCLLIKQSTD